MALFGLGKKKSGEDVEPEYIESPLKTPMLNYKTYVMGTSETITVRFALFFLGGIAGMVFYSGLFKDEEGYATFATHVSDVVIFVGMGIIANVAFMGMYVRSRLEKRKVELSHQFRDMLDALSSSFSTGSNVTMAFRSALTDMRRQHGDSAYITRELEEIVEAERQSFPVEQMLRNFADRSGDEDIESFADVFGIFARKGGSMQSIVQRMRNILTEKADIADEIRTKLTSNKIQHNAMSVMPIVIVLVLKVSNPSFAENFTTPVGVACCTVAIGIFIASYLYGKKIINVKV